MNAGFVDARSSDLPDIINARVCIVGAGAAGITLARRLGKTMDGIVLVESGGFELEGDTQGLFAGRNLGLPYYNLTACRLRYFGGTTNHWSGYCRANDAIDYAGRPELGLPAWPLTHDDLDEYIAAAGASLGITAEHFDPTAVMQHRGIPHYELAESRSDILQTKIFQLAPNKRLGLLSREELASSKNIHTYLHLNLVHIQLAHDGHAVQHVECRTLNGKATRVVAQQYVLCCHAIENARQLLASNDIATAGIGNHADHVGRYFMDHIHIRASVLIPSPSFPRTYDRTFSRNYAINANLSFSDRVIAERKLLQYYCRFNPRHAPYEAQRAASAVQANFFNPGDLDFLRDVATVLQYSEELTQQLLAQRNLWYVHPAYYGLEHRIEQAPNPASRVLLSNERDALGCQIADLDWRISNVDVESFRNGQALIAQELAAAGYGRIREEEITRSLVEDRVAGHFHQIGTTRMSARPSDGVVDANCKVHGVANLYIGGSSVFPTAGYSGPTMMIIALAMRLADHIRSRVL